MLAEDSAEEDEEFISGPFRKKRALMASDPPELEVDEPLQIKYNFTLLPTTGFEEEFDEPLAERQVTQIILDPTLAKEDFCNSVVRDEKSNSAEFDEAQAAINEDAWDVCSWMIFLDEVEHCRSGSLTFDVACERFLGQFPRCAKIWHKLSEHWRSTGDISRADQVLLNGAKKCWNVDLWLMYAQTLVEKYKLVTSNKDLQRFEQTKCEAAFELALDQVGLAWDSSSLWGAYISFVHDWPTVDPLDRNQRITTLRRVYQRVVCSAIDNVESFWIQYEDFERELGTDTQNESAFQDVHKKHLHCKSVCRDRREKVKNIVFDRLSTPPTNTSAELQQLEYWSEWISFEQGNPDYLHADACNSMVRMVYQQCLCCFLHNVEVWMGFSRFELSVSNDHEAARVILQEGVNAIPESALLRIALAELEEEHGCLDAAGEIFRSMFEQFKDGFSFSVYQRFVRRTLGVVAARQIFSETLPMRRTDVNLSVQIFLAHASTELDMNANPTIALRVLTVAREKYPDIVRKIEFVRLISRVLVQLGDAQQLRLILQSALDEVAKEEPCEDFDGQKTPTNELRLHKEFDLLDEVIRAEITMGLTSSHCLNAMHKRRNRVRIQLEELKRSRSLFPSKNEHRKSAIFFEYCDELFERHNVNLIRNLPEADADLRDRCRDTIVVESDRYHERGKSGRENREVKHFSTEFQLSLSGLPAILRDLVANLPPYFGAQPDCDGFLRHMKSVVLPPRPQVTQDDFSKIDTERVIVEDEDLEVDLKDSSINDVFRQRQRST